MSRHLDGDIVPPSRRFERVIMYQFDNVNGRLPMNLSAIKPSRVDLNQIF